MKVLQFILLPVKIEMSFFFPEEIQLFDISVFFMILFFTLLFLGHLHTYLMFLVPNLE